MGNRCTVIHQTADGRVSAVTVYQQWNGGPESVYAILDAMVIAEPRNDSAENLAARYYQLLANWFGGRLSVYMQPTTMDAKGGYYSGDGDNGAYLVRWARDGGSYTVRRWVPCDGRELSSAEVADERRAAARHSYNQPVDRDGKPHMTVTSAVLEASAMLLAAP